MPIDDNAVLQEICRQDIQDLGLTWYYTSVLD